MESSKRVIGDGTLSNVVIAWMLPNDVIGDGTFPHGKSTSLLQEEAYANLTEFKREIMALKDKIKMCTFDQVVPCSVHLTNQNFWPKLWNCNDLPG